MHWFIVKNESRNLCSTFKTLKDILILTTIQRFSEGKPLERPKVLFADVSRDDADKSVLLLIKYLFNYGFYKFGIEVTLVVLTMVISFRKDIMSILYVIWLCVMFGTRRGSKQRLWPLFQYFVTFATIAQYAIILNLPPILQQSELLWKMQLSFFIKCHFNLFFIPRFSA